jgi:hypothetical protein
MNEMILLKLGEMVLKGLNRRSFEDKLHANIHRRLNDLGQFKVYTRQSTTYVEPKDDSCDVLGAYEVLKKVFGIALMRTEGVRVNGVCLFVRTILGKYTIETMVPVYLVILLIFGSVGVIGSGAMLLLAIAQLCIMLFTANNSLIHDLIAGTAVADMSLQKIFNSSDELLEYKNKLHAERVANSVY